MTDQTEPDSCRPVEVDGETIRVRGAGEMSDEGRAALAEVVRAATRRTNGQTASSETVASTILGVVTAAIEVHGQWMPADARRAVAYSIHDGILEHFETSDTTLREQVTKLRDDLREITGARWIADALDTILNPPQPAAYDGPSVEEAAANDRNWDIQREGE